MPFTPVGAGRQDDDAPRTYLNPSDMVGHLLLVWPVRYEADTVTKYPRQDGRPSDAVYVDVVDLNLPDETNQPGKVMRAAKWTQGRLIRDTKHAVGVPRDDGMLVQMGKDGDAYQIIDMTTNPGAVQYANNWLAAHPQFQPGNDAPQRQQEPQYAPAANGAVPGQYEASHAPVPGGWPIRETPPYSGNYPMPAPPYGVPAHEEPSRVWLPTSGAPSVPAAPVPPAQDVRVQALQESVMDRLRRQASGSNPYAPPAQPNLPPYPGFQDENPPF